MDDLIKFIKLIPDSILLESIEKINYSNRTERRKYERIKPLDNKINAILSKIQYRVELIEILYQKYNTDNANSEALTYDEILSSIEANNCIDKTLLMLHRCCDTEFDKKYFIDFMTSDPFQKTINNEWKKEEVTPNTLDLLKNIDEENNKMKYYLGHIESRTTHYNFIPKFVYNADNKSIQEISQQKLEVEFPIYGSINLAYKKRFGEAHNFLLSLNVDKATNVTNATSIYVVKFKEEDLKDSDDEKIKKKLELEDWLDSGEKLDQRIIPASEIHMFKIVTPQENITKESFSGMIFVNEINYHANEDVLLEYGSEHNLFGPFTLQERSIDGAKYIRPNISAHHYYLEYYKEEDYELVPFEIHPYMPEPIYTDIAFIKNKPHYFDVISDSNLLVKLTDSIDTNLLSTNPEEFERLYSTSPFLGNIPKEIRDERVERIHDILENTSEYDDIKSKALTTLIDSIDDNLLVKKIQNSEQYKALLKKLSEEQKTYEELKEQNEHLEADNSRLKNKLANCEETRFSGDQTDYVKELEQKNLQLEERLSLVEDFERLSNEYNEMQDNYAQAQKSYDDKVLELNEKKKELKKIENEVKAFISKELNSADTTKMLRTAFDPYISNAMIEAAGNYRDDEEMAQYKNISNEMQIVDCQEIGKKELIDTLVEGVQKIRNYKRNDIINMYICLSQNFLTIFSGEPGTGKTSICNILASSLGLNKFGKSNNISKNRYVPVSVERGWTSKRDLIGYFNPLTKKYDRSNAKIYDGLMILNEENKNSRFPFLILLDEANLSPIEYYWADFMRAADRLENDIYINIGLDQDIYIPKTLHFLATVNNDQTTERLSPRLIDRAWIVKLPKTSITEATVNPEDCFSNIVLWSDFEKAFVFSDSKEMSLKTVAEQIYKLFDEHHLTVSPRIQQSIKKYVCVAQEIMEDEVDVTKKQKALDYAITQKLLPKINGYYKDYERLFESLTQICDENGLKMTKEALISMEDFQKQNMGYCRYLV